MPISANDISTLIFVLIGFSILLWVAIRMDKKTDLSEDLK